MVKLFLAKEVPTEVSEKEDKLKEERDNCRLPELSRHSPEKHIRYNEGNHTPFN